SGRLGRKGRRGFYQYDEDGRKGAEDISIYEILSARSARVDFPTEEIQARCGLALVNEAVRALEEGVVRSPRDGDIGAVFGIGFPPFRGGPFRYVDAVGAAKIVEQLEELHARFAPRFAPS